MKIRELNRLPIGTHELTNGIYNYILEKSLTDSREIIYSMKIKRDPWYSDNVCFFEDFEQDEDEDFKRPTLRALSGIRGFRIHSDYSGFISSMWELERVSRGSFKEFVKRTS